MRVNKWMKKFDATLSLTVFNFSWLCGTQSPCADVGPNFPGNAEYYFKLEFSNRYRVVEVETT